MANWAYNIIAFYQEDGGEENVKLFGEHVNKIHGEYLKAEKNPFQEWWMGSLLLHENNNDEGIDDDLDYRAFIEDFNIQPDHVELVVSSAWGPKPHLYTAIANLFDLRQVYICDEENNGLFINTDAESRYFSDRFYVPYMDDQTLLDYAPNPMSDEELERLVGFFSEPQYFDEFESLKEHLQPLGIIGDDFKSLCEDAAEKGFNIYEYKSEYPSIEEILKELEGE